MAEKDSGLSFVVGFVLGAAAGVAIGFLYAPRPGKETREIMREKALEISEKAKEAAAEARERVEEKLGRKKETE